MMKITPILMIFALAIMTISVTGMYNVMDNINSHKNCDFVNGDYNGTAKQQVRLRKTINGQGLSEKITGQQCARECAQFPQFNGATIKTDRTGFCWCNEGMSDEKNNVNENKVFSTCKFDKSWRALDHATTVASTTGSTGYTMDERVVRKSNG